MTIVGGVFSQAEGFTTLGQLWPGLAFHAVATALGTGMLGKSIGPRPVAAAGAAAEDAQSLPPGGAREAA